MQDLVGVGVADGGKDARVGEGALERVPLSAERGAKRIEVEPVELEPPMSVPPRSSASRCSM